MADERPFGGDDVELLRKDFDHWLASFVQNEELGDKRLNFFTTIVTGVFGGLGFLAKDGKDAVAGIEMSVLMAFASLVLLLLGCVTTLRLQRRKEVTQGYLRAADRLRQILTPAWAKEYKDLVPKSGHDLKFGGLVHFTAVLNGGLAAVLVWSAAKMVHVDTNTATLSAFGMLVFLVVAQWMYFGRDRKPGRSDPGK